VNVDLGNQDMGIFSGAAAKVNRLWKSYKKLREAASISNHFAKYLAPKVANSANLKQEVFKIRHNVYCDELAFEPVKPDGMEVDEFDAFSVHCLIQHIATETYAGTIRLVTPREEGQLLPIEKYCANAIEHPEFTPDKLDRRQICELSRLAVPEQFRRRKFDSHPGAATGVINEEVYSETELRCFPFIAIGLYMSAASIAFKMGINHAFVMMEPRLARSMGFIGIKFVKIGPTIEYHGQRAPYYINAELLMKSLSPSFRMMLKDIQNTINKQVNLPSEL